jgi:hypothetical protein
MEDDVMEDDVAADRLAFEQNIMSNPMIMAQIAKMPPEEKAEYIDQMFRDYAGEGALLDEQLSSANELRNVKGREGLSHGDVYVADYGSIGDMMGAYKGNKDRDAAREGLQDLSDSRTAGLGRTANAAADGYSAVVEANDKQKAKKQANTLSPLEQAAIEQIELSEGLRSVPA